MRGLDAHMTENFANALEANVNLEGRFKRTLLKQTHIIDTLFPRDPLTDFKTIYGGKDVIDLKSHKLAELFGVDDEYKEYLRLASQVNKRINNMIHQRVDSCYVKQ